MVKRVRRRVLDDWFPTIARYGGLAILVYAFFIDRLRNPALPPIGLGLIVVEKVKDGR